MATHIGRGGLVKVGATGESAAVNITVLELRGWSFDTAGGTTPDTVMGDTWDTHKATIKSWSGSMNVLWDPADTTGQEVLIEGAPATVTFWPDPDRTGATLGVSGDITYQGAIIVTGVGRSASHDGLIESAISFIGNGAVTKTTATA